MYSRLVNLSKILRERKIYRLADLEDELEASRKTLQADINQLRDLGHPIENSRKDGWVYTGPPPELALSLDELFAILVAEKTLSSYRGTPFELPLREVFRRFSGQEAPVLKCSWDFLGSAVTVKSSGITTADLNIYRRVVTAVAMQKELQLNYKGMKDAFPQSRRVQPYHLCCTGNSWYLLAFDVKAAKVKTFAIPRIRKADVLQTTFPRPDREAIKKEIDGSFGVFFEAKPEKLVVAFSNIIAMWISERRWHASQEIETTSDGIVLTLYVGISPEIEQWILSFGENARVLAPAHLAALIAKRLQAAAEGYAVETAVKKIG